MRVESASGFGWNGSLTFGDMMFCALKRPETLERLRVGERSGGNATVEGMGIEVILCGN
jgi:hypothetical protein